MRPPLTLRMRLVLIILPPLVAVATMLGTLRYLDARATSEDLFDRALLTAALAISRDVAVSGGDALSTATHDLIREATQDEVFYHVYAPDGVFVTGFATPPVPPAGARDITLQPVYYDAVYRGEKVRALRLSESAVIGNLSGYTTVTVWQTFGNRDALTRSLATRAVSLMGLMILAAMVIVWTGVDFGLRPLTGLRQAISRRSPEDLRSIARPLPDELRGIVETINSLFTRLQSAFDARDRFISDAAHQLRNPVAGLLSTAEALPHAPDGPARQQREADLLQAARHASRVTNQLLSFERLIAQPHERAVLDLEMLVREVVERKAPEALRSRIDLGLETTGGPFPIKVNRTDIREAIENLIDNAMTHGGPTLTRIDVRLGCQGNTVCLTICDNGKGLPLAQWSRALERFTQLDNGAGSGLGLPIAKHATESNGGTLEPDQTERGLSVTMRFPKK